MRLPRAKAKGKRCYHRKKTNKADADGWERELEASVELEEAWRLLCRDAEGSLKPGFLNALPVPSLPDRRRIGTPLGSGVCTICCVHKKRLTSVIDINKKQ